MIFLILLTSFILRLIAINQSFWLDEAINVYYATKLPFIEFISQYPYGDFHPVGYFLMLWPVVHQFGASEIATRLISVLFGVASVWLVFLIAKEFFNRQIGLVASLLLAFNPLHIYYSTEARMYAFAAFAVTLSLLCLIKLLKGVKLAPLFYFFSLVIVLYSDYLAYFAVPIQLLFVGLFYKKKLRQVFILQIISLICFIPGILLLIKQLEVGLGTVLSNPNWAKIVGSNSLKELGLSLIKPLIGKISFDNKYLYGGISLALLGVYSFLFFKAFKKTKEFTLLIFWFSIPIAGSYLFSFFVPIFSYFRLLYIIPALCLITACGIAQFRKRNGYLALTLLITISISFLFPYYFNPRAQRENWKEAVATVESQAFLTANILFEDNNILTPYLLYSKDSTNAYPGLLRVPAVSLSDVKTEGLENDQIFVFEYLVQINDPARLLEAKIKEKGFHESKKLNFQGVGFVRIFEHD